MRIFYCMSEHHRHIAKVLIKIVWRLLFMPLVAEIEQLKRKNVFNREYFNLAGLRMEELL